MRDRISTQVLANGAIRYAEYDNSGNFVQYRYLLPADAPSVEGTALNKANLLTDEAATFLGLSGDNAVPSKAFLRCRFTFVVDSNAALAAWATAASGNDYTSVLIKSGSWTYAGGVNLYAAGTRVVVGEKGNMLNLSGTRGLYYSTNYSGVSRFDDYIVGVNVTLTGTSDMTQIFAFANCVHLVSCKGYAYIGSAPIAANVRGFYNCQNLLWCIGYAQGNSSGIAFQDCVYLEECAGAGIGSSGYGFYGCIAVRYCRGTRNIGGSASTVSTFSTTTCSANSGSYNGTYAAANTPEGGFNNLE